METMQLEDRTLNSRIRDSIGAFRFEWTLPNLFTLSRLFMIPFQVYFLVIGKPFWAFVALFLSALTDLLDGYLARRLNCRTVTGAMLDPLIDKMTIMAMFFTLIYLQIIPLWFAFLMLTRDFIILLGVFILLLCRKRVPFRPVLFGKIATLSQNSTLLGFIVYHYFWLPEALLYFLIAATTVLTLISLLQYVQLFFIVHGQESKPLRP
jgi:cardiolipin synthase